MQAHRAREVATFKRYRLYEQGEAAREDARLDPIRLASLDVPQVALGNPKLARGRLDREPAALAHLAAARGHGMEPDAVARLVRELDPRAPLAPNRSCRRRAQGRLERRPIRRDELLAP